MSYSYIFILFLVFYLGYKVTDQWFEIKRLKQKADKWDEVVKAYILENKKPSK